MKAELEALRQKNREKRKEIMEEYRDAVKKAREERKGKGSAKAKFTA